MSELDALDPVPEQVKLQSGTVVVLEDLRARQFFKLLRIVTHGALPLVQTGELFNVDDAGEFAGRLLSVMLLAVPDAGDESIEFVRSMCKPAGLIEGRNLGRHEQERNAYLHAQLDDALTNPELDDLVTIIEAIVKREAADIQALGKRLAAMFKLAEKTGQVPRSPTSPTSISSADSPSPSTSSRRSTAGRTAKSRTSPSAASDSVSPPSDDGASTTTGDGSSS